MGTYAALLDDKYARESGPVLLTGIQALVRLPLMQRQRDIAAGLDTAGFISGYRGSPLAGLDQALWKAADHLAAHQITFTPGLNEDLAATAVWGSQQVNLFPGARHDGVFGMWYGKGPGVDRCGDVFRHANAAGSSPHGGVLVIAGDDHAARSSTLPHQTEHLFKAVMMPVLAPAGVQEYLDFGLHGWALSRYSGCWVAMTAVGDTVESGAIVDVDPGRVQPVTPDDFTLPPGGLGIRWPDPPLAQEERLLHHKLYAALAYARANHLNRLTVDAPGARLGVITAGKSWLDVCQALDLLDIDLDMAARIGLRVYKVGMTWPLESQGVREFADGLEEILVVEEKRQLIEYQLKEELYNWREDVRPRIIGKFDEKGEWSLPHGDWLLPAAGELAPAQIARVLATRILRLGDNPEIAARLATLEASRRIHARAPLGFERQPHYCSGCPHNRSTRVPEGSRAMAGIGCHYMATWIYPEQTRTFSQMGGEGAAWIGQAPFTDTSHVFANLGDGTYVHSGLLAIRAAVAAGVTMTYKILFNDAVAMTGGQPVEGNPSVAGIARQLLAEGVKPVIVVSDAPEKYAGDDALPATAAVRHRDDLDAVQEELRLLPGVSALIYDQTCAAERRRRRKRGQSPDPARRVFINERVCEGCGDCSRKSDCLSVTSVETEFGRKRAIDQSSCNKDFSCLDGFCPSFVTIEGGRLRRPAAVHDKDADWTLPEPVLPPLATPWNILVTGVGGTGVITIGALLGMAAQIEGRGVLTLDMTGLAQKGGAVWSHVRLAGSQAQLFSPRIAESEAHVVLGCDLVVSAHPDSLARMQRGRTRAVINTAENITSSFVRDFDQQAASGDIASHPDPQFPAAAMVQEIREETGSSCDFVAASTLAGALLGDAMATNIFLLGYAWQRGLVPLGEAALLTAIERNETAVAMNLAAFRWGRRAAHDLARVQALVDKSATPEPDRELSQDLTDMVARRYDYLTDYQNRAYADRYLALVERVKAAEAHCLGHVDALSEAVARNYFKVLAVKDEYEVARLHSNGDFLRHIKANFEGDYRIHFHLAPMIFQRGDGEPKKREYGPWMLPLFRLLASLRFLRQTPFDPFGHTAERRLEQQWRTDYEQHLEEIMAQLQRSNHDTAVQIARLPDEVRGYGPVKARYMVRAREHEAVLLDAFRHGLLPVVTTGDAA